jgi:hypothetical protein
MYSEILVCVSTTEVVFPLEKALRLIRSYLEQWLTLKLSPAAPQNRIRRLAPHRFQGDAFLTISRLVSRYPFRASRRLLSFDPRLSVSKRWTMIVETAGFSVHNSLLSASSCGIAKGRFYAPDATPCIGHGSRLAIACTAVCSGAIHAPAGKQHRVVEYCSTQSTAASTELHEQRHIHEQSGTESATA